MSCWVVPTLAAELWRMPLEQVMKMIREGSVPTKQDEGFTFIDVAPNSPKLEPRQARSEKRPPTFIPAADEQDIDVLLMDDAFEQEVAAGDEEEEVSNFSDWREARAKISLTRIGPMPRRRSA